MSSTFEPLPTSDVEESYTAELPEPPTAPTSSAIAEVDGTFDTGFMETVPASGDPLPQGTYHMRLDSVTEAWETDQGPEKQPFGPQPYFVLSWICQQEPYTGRRVGQFINWVTPDVVKLAKNGDSKAKSYCFNRLGDARMVTQKLHFAGSNIKDLFAAHPEGKLTLTLKDKKTYVTNEAGVKELRATGEKDNRIVKIEPIFSQR